MSIVPKAENRFKYLKGSPRPLATGLAAGPRAGSAEAQAVGLPQVVLQGLKEIFVDSLHGSGGRAVAGRVRPGGDFLDQELLAVDAVHDTGEALRFCGLRVQEAQPSLGPVLDAADQRLFLGVFV